MIIAIPKEIISGENRVACVPDVASKYIKAGFEVQIESNAGLNAGFTNEDYEKYVKWVKDGSIIRFYNSDK